jgi:peptidoglycan hydrolase CwlO-like protein
MGDPRVLASMVANVQAGLAALDAAESSRLELAKVGAVSTLFDIYSKPLFDLSTTQQLCLPTPKSSTPFYTQQPNQVQEVITELESAERRLEREVRQQQEKLLMLRAQAEDTHARLERETAQIDQLSSTITARKDEVKHVEGQAKVARREVDVAERDLMEVFLSPFFFPLVFVLCT